tara:strand:- start:457 stop:570 length:114 start_codon:yes stop_codon:yes gene_type:complete
MLKFKGIAVIKLCEENAALKIQYIGIIKIDKYKTTNE